MYRKADQELPSKPTLEEYATSFIVYYSHGAVIQDEATPFYSPRLHEFHDLEVDLETINTFYLEVPKIDALNLVMMLLFHNSSLSNWDYSFGKGRFLAALAKLLTHKFQPLLFIFEHSLPNLHQQEQLFSLK